MRKLVFHLVMALALYAGTANAVIIDNSTPIPDANILVNYNGLDWVYAGPIAPNEFGPGQIYEPSYRSGEGWRFATQAEWAVRPDWTAFIQPGFTTADVPAIDGWSDHSKYRFASEYWSDFSHVDLNDAASGWLTNGFDIGSLHSVYETWYVRDNGGSEPVPEPSTMLLLGGGLAGLAIWRKRKQ